MDRWHALQVWSCGVFFILWCLPWGSPIAQMRLGKVGEWARGFAVESAGLAKAAVVTPAARLAKYPSAKQDAATPGRK